MGVEPWQTEQRAECFGALKSISGFGEMQNMKCCGLCSANIENGETSTLFSQLSSILDTLLRPAYVFMRLNVEIVCVGLFATEIMELKSSKLFGNCLWHMAAKQEFVGR